MTNYIVVTGDGAELCSGVSEHEIVSVAQAHADRLGETVYYSAMDGEGLDANDEDIGIAVEPSAEADTRRLLGHAAARLREIGYTVALQADRLLVPVADADDYDIVRRCLGDEYDVEWADADEDGPTEIVITV